MFDAPAVPSDPGLVEVADYVELGRLVVDWTCNEDTRPTSVAALASQLDGIARVPGIYKDVVFVEGRRDVLVIRLPEKERTQATLDEVETLLVSDAYRLPAFYDDIYQRSFGPVMSPLDTFLARMGDYSIVQCR